jgi:hypothetical protein
LANEEIFQDPGKLGYWFEMGGELVLFGKQVVSFFLKNYVLQGA